MHPPIRENSSEGLGRRETPGSAPPPVTGVTKVARHADRIRQIPRNDAEIRAEIDTFKAVVPTIGGHPLFDFLNTM